MRKLQIIILIFLTQNNFCFGIQSDQSNRNECWLSKADSETKIEISKFENISELLAEYYANENEIDVLLFETVSGNVDLNSVRLISVNDKVVTKADKLGNSILVRSNIDESSASNICLMLERIKESFYVLTCQSYSSLTRNKVYSIKSKGKPLFSISYNLDRLTDGLTEEQIFALNNEIELLDLIMSLE